MSELLAVLLGEEDSAVRLQRAQLTDLTGIGIAQLGRLDRAVFALREHHQVKHRMVLLSISAFSSDAISPEKFAFRSRLHPCPHQASGQTGKLTP